MKIPEREAKERPYSDRITPPDAGGHSDRLRGTPGLRFLLWEKENPTLRIMGSWEAHWKSVLTSWSTTGSNRMISENVLT